jgi:hypothetical protein
MEELDLVSNIAEREGTGSAIHDLAVLVQRKIRERAPDEQNSV